MLKRFIWPSNQNANPSAVVVAGRVLYWIGSLLSAGAGITALMTLISAGYQAASNNPAAAILSFTFGYLALGVGVVVYFIGRTFRFLLSGE